MDLISPKGSHVQARGPLAERLLRKGYSRVDAPDAVDFDDEPEDEQVPADVPAEGDSAPAVGEPRGNASTEAWAAYARDLGVEFPKDATRKDIQEAIDAR